jgi:ribosomal protein S18 acetylase RimI-like enzyme
MDESIISLRPIQPADHEFLCRVYASTREQELAPVPWTPAQKEAFLRSQFDAQHQYYQEHYTGASFQVILRDGHPAGRLYVARWGEEIRIVDIALLPEHRRAGIGSSLLKELLAEGARAQKPVTIHVEQFNPARRWYERLGFRKQGEFGVYLLLEFSPVSASAQRTLPALHAPDAFDPLSPRGTSGERSGERDQLDHASVPSRPTPPIRREEAVASPRRSMARRGDSQVAAASPAPPELPPSFGTPSAFKFPGPLCPPKLCADAFPRRTERASGICLARPGI